MTSYFRFTCVLSCMLILRQCQWSTIFLRKFFWNYNKMSSPVPVPKHWCGFSYIRYEYYELDQSFDETELK